MINPFRRRRFKRIPPHKRKIYVSDFLPQARLEILLNQYIELYQMDTAMSLDRDGFSPEKIEHYEKERWVFAKRHGKELIEYLAPYEAIPNGVPLLADERRRSDARDRLISDLKKTESE